MKNQICCSGNAINITLTLDDTFPLIEGFSCCGSQAYNNLFQACCGSVVVNRARKYRAIEEIDQLSLNLTSFQSCCGADLVS